MSDNAELIIARLIKTYGTPPPTRVAPEDFESFCREYLDAMNGFSPTVVQKAMDEVIKANTYQSWPVVGQIYQACKKYVPPARHESPNWGEEAKEPPTPEQVANVRRMAAVFRESVRPMTAPTWKDSAEKLKDTPYAGIFQVDRKSWVEKEKRWNAAERVDGVATGRRMRDVVKK